MTSGTADANPLLEPWGGPFEAPPFDRIEARHFRPEIEARIANYRSGKPHIQGATLAAAE